MLESVISWLTPTALFLLLNLVIGTIAFTSSRSSSSSSSSDLSAGGGPHHTFSKLCRSPSIVLDRLKSFNLYSSYHPSDPTTDAIQTVQIPKIEQCEPKPEAPQPEPEHHFARSQSDTQPAAGEMPKKLAKKMKKSATLKSAFNHFDFHEQEEQVSSPPKRPATTRERVKVKDEDAEVDARADDFINRFKHQLKLQRLDSIIRYKEMLNRGT